MDNLNLENQSSEPEEGSSNDVDLLTKYLAGDQRAFESLVHRYEWSFHLLAYGFLRDEEAVKDALQEFWLKISRTEILQMYDGRSSFKTWLYSVLNHVCLDMLRHLKSVHRVIPVAEIDEYTASGEESLPLHERLELKRSMNKILAQLNTKSVEILMRRFENDQEYKEIAADLEIPIGTVRSRIFYSLGKVRDLIISTPGNE